MTSATINVNPALTTNAQGSFPTTTSGLIQGTAFDDPAVRNELAGGVLANNETLPMWGGVGIFEQVPSGVTGFAPVQTGFESSLGGMIGRATALTGAAALTGFSVFNQAHAMINTPQSPVPVALNGMNVEFYRLGSNARIAVACDANLVSVEGQLITSQLSWDFVNQQLVPYAAVTVNSGTYNTVTGAVSLVTAAPHGLLPGDVFIPTLTGTGAFANLNVPQVLTAGTTGTTINFVAATGLTLTITGGTGATGGILPVRVLQIEIGKSMTVSYNATTGFATWNRSGSAAVILI